MGRLQTPIRPWNASRFYRRKTKPSIFPCRNAPIPAKSGLDRFFLRIIRMRVFSLRVGLPDFDDSVRHRNAIAVQNATRNFYALTGDAGRRKVVAIEPRETNPEKRPDGLRSGRGNAHDF